MKQDVLSTGIMPKVVHCKIAPRGTFKYVGRPTKYGNPFSHKDGTKALYKTSTVEEAVQKFEEWFLAQHDLIEDAKKELAGWDLACWCKTPRNPNKPCHADVILRIVNEI